MYRNKRINCPGLCGQHNSGQFCYRVLYVLFTSADIIFVDIVAPV